jgi:hypothetical protein
LSNARGIRGSRGGDVTIERRRRDTEPLRDLSYSDVGIGEHRLHLLDAEHRRQNADSLARLGMLTGMAHRAFARKSVIEIEDPKDDE